MSYLGTEREMCTKLQNIYHISVRHDTASLLFLYLREKRTEFIQLVLSVWLLTTALIIKEGHSEHFLHLSWQGQTIKV